MINNLIVFLSPDWEVSYRASMFRELARQLVPRGGQIICFNRPIFVLSDLFSNPKRWMQILANKLIKPATNITVYRPILFLHPLISRRLPKFNNYQRKFYRKKIEILFQDHSLEPKNTAWWVSHPYHFMETDLPQDGKVVYERYDKYDQSIGLNADQAGLVAGLDRKLAERADLIITTSVNLARELDEFKAKVQYLPNSADYEYFSNVDTAKGIKGTLAGKIKKPVIGYLGTIHEGLDISLISRLAEIKKEWTFMLVGPVQSEKIKNEPGFKKMQNLPNVVMTGWLDWAMLPSYLKLFDVGIIPYRLDCGFNRYVDPNKFHEYMALGLPVVTTSLPEMGKYREWVETADTPEAFKTAIEKVLDQDSDMLRADRKKYARENGWEQRAAKIISSLDKII